MVQTLDEIKQGYVKAMHLAVSILVCNYAGLNQAIDMGLDRKGLHQHFTLPKVKMQYLAEQVGGPVLRKASMDNLAKRVLLVEALCELMMADTIEAQDIEDCIDDYMEMNFDVNAVEVDDHLEIGDTLVKVRQELTQCAKTGTDMMQAQSLQDLIAFNKENQSKLEGIEKMAKEQAVDLISESSGFESIYGDSVCDSYHSSDEDKPPNVGGSDSDDEVPKLKGPVVDDDGFETVSEKKRRR